MNGSLKEYVLRIIAAAMVCAIVKSLTAKTTVVNSIIKTLCGVFLILSILSPVVSLDFSAITEYINVFSADADRCIETGIRFSDVSMRSSIKEYTEAYIVDKAASLKSEIKVEVTLSNDEVPVPCSVKLEGRISPYAKSRLTQLIADDLGISKEKQTWI